MAVVFFFITNERVSILENTAHMGRKIVDSNF
ncbi:MAG: phage holin family protein [Eubacteriales bacterium]